MRFMGDGFFQNYIYEHIKDKNMWEALTAVATFCLAITTVWLGCETRNVAKSTKRTLELENEPYLFVKISNCEMDFVILPTRQFQLNKIRVIFWFTNPSKIPIEFKMNRILMSLGGSNFDSNDATYVNTKVVAIQGQGENFNNDIFPLSPPLLVPPSDSAAKATVDIDFDYWRLGYPRSKKNLKKSFEMTFWDKGIEIGCRFLPKED